MGVQRSRESSRVIGKATFRAPAEWNRESLYKRPLDLAILVLAYLPVLPVWALVWLLISLAIWLEDRGPVFYLQDRVGLNGRVFRLVKFRSMRVRRDDGQWPENTAEDDDRITHVGRFLRRTALDELPQIINLLRGDISLVGPRGLPVKMHEEYVKDEPRFVRRLAVRPGLTGLAQIYLPRHCDARRRLKYDIVYIRRSSHRLDLKVIIISVWLTLTGKWGMGPRVPEAAVRALRGN